MKRPSFQFYPGDWQANSKLRRCTHEEKGIWMDVLCILHDQEEYGVARWPLKELAESVGSTTAKLRALVNKGVLKGADAGQSCDALIYVPRSGRKNGPPVTLLGAQEGPIWYSSRMVEDEHKRIIRAEAGASPKDAPKPPFGDTKDESPDAHHSRARPSSPSSSPPSGNTSSQPGAREPMRTGWQPSPHVADQARLAMAQITPAIQQEFIAHWLTKPETQRTQAEWDKALLQSALHAKAAGASKPAKGSKPDNFEERDYGKEILPL